MADPAQTVTSGYDEVMSLAPGAPSPPLYTIRQTPNAGRGLFAAQDIPSGTPLIVTGPPVLSVILREYRREVCAQCFGYDRGREWKMRDAKVNFSYCSDACKRQWREETGEGGIAAWQAAEQLIQSSQKRRTGGGNGDDNHDHDEQMPDAVAVRPTPAEITTAWADGQERARLLIMLRTKQPESKAARRALTAALAPPAAPDTLALLVAAILCYTDNPQAWQEVLGLAPDPQPYTSEHNLDEHIRSLTHLVAVLPLEVLSHGVTDLPRVMLRHEMHNSFGIRSLEDDGDEFFGYGVWPSASYTNHACQPNIAKRRIGRSWEFCTARDVKAGEELCISYLGGEEKALDALQRRRRLQDTWGFQCGCARCVDEGLL